MGAGSSKASAAGESKDGGTERECRTYKVRPLENLCDGEDHIPCLTMQFGPEAVTFHTPEGVLYRAFAYHEILSWGHNTDSFQFRVHKEAMGTLITVVLGTREGDAMEEDIMGTVLHLMDDMKAVGVSEAEFASLLQALADDPDRLLEDVRSVSLTKAFDAKQASTLVARVGELSPFDQLEAAVLLYDALINKHSFNLVLDVLEEDADRDNVCHRLGIIRNPDGTFKHLPKRAKVVREHLAADRPAAAAAAAGGGGSATHK